MPEGTTRRRVGTVLVAIVGSGMAGVMLAPPAAALHVEQYIEVPQCQPATSQECPQKPEVKFSAGQNEHIQAQFTANANHCSDILVRFLVDNYPQGDWVRAGPGQTVANPAPLRGAEITSSASPPRASRAAATPAC
ncbi:MAG TPA: hypothetical protein VFB19_19025 [Mycobacterium sp.]|nr:hypothetical protein [Mycobacterium sp.]